MMMCERLLGLLGLLLGLFRVIYTSTASALKIGLYILKRGDIPISYHRDI